MIDYLASYFYQSQSWPYQLGEGILRHFYKIFGLFGLMLTAYPLWLLSYYSFPSALEAEQAMLYEQLESRQKILAVLREKQNTSAQVQNFAEINQQIKQVLQQNHIHSETLQWQFEGGRMLNLSTVQTSENLLNAVADLNRIEHLSFLDITLTKLHQNRLVEMNALLKLNE